MNDFKQSVCALLILILTNCCLNSLYAADPPVEPETVKKIKKVATQVLTTNPPQLFVAVSGEVPSGGFTDVTLTRVSYRKPPEDGIQDYYLKAVPPTQPAIAVISEVKAQDRWVGMPFWVKGIRVHGIDDGVKVVKFEQKPEPPKPVHRQFTGTADAGLGVGSSIPFEQALASAVYELQLSLTEGDVKDATATWKLLTTSGKVGSIDNMNRITVTIVAERQPPWPKKKQPKKEQPQKKTKVDK